VANGELYFASSAVPAGAVLTGWLLTEVRPARWAGAMLFAGAAYGALLGAVLFRYGPGREVGPWPVLWRHLLGEPVIALVEVILVGVLGWWALRARWPLLAGSGVAVLVAASVGLGVDTTVRSTSAGIRSVLAGRLPSAGTKRSFWVTAQEMRAAEWVASNAPPRDVVATNVHCELVRTTKTCISRSFWVSAVSEHAVALEGWAYQDSVMARHGVNGLPYFRQPAPDRALLRINDDAFTAPTETGLATLRDRYGARWLFADRRAGPVSARLSRLADVRYRSGPVTIYRLPG